MGPNLDPGQRLFIAWLVHHLRAQVHVIDAYAAALLQDAAASEQRADADAIRRVVGRIVDGLDELLATPFDDGESVRPS